MTQSIQSIAILTILGLVALCIGPWITHCTLSRRHERAIIRLKVEQKNICERGMRKLEERLVHERQEANRARSNASEVIEKLCVEHEEELAALRTQHAKELTAAHACGHVATLLEAQLIDEMADKLSLASATFHAKQQFSDARKANQLSTRGHTLALRMRSQVEALRTEGAAA